MDTAAAVQLYVYDLSGGIARSLSLPLLGTQIDAIYHTSIVVRGIEHYFGGGINIATAGTTPFGYPIQKLDLGHTYLDETTIEALLVDLSERFTPESYSLFDNNCNNFSNELAQLLTGNSIPSHITGLPATVLSTPFGQMMRPMLAGLESQMRAMRSQAFTPSSHHYPLSSATEGSVPAFEDVGSFENTTTATTTETRVVVEEKDLEKELEVAVAEAALTDMNQQLEELDMKEGRATPRQQLGSQGALRMATEIELKKELDKIIAERHENGSDSGSDVKEAEALAVERVAAAHGHVTDHASDTVNSGSETMTK